MKHTPYGYRIVGGRAVVNEEEAAILKKICMNYLSGMSFVNSAADAGLKKSHAGVKRMLLNRKYAGDDFYPAIFTKETMDAVEEERLKREKQLGRDNKAKKDRTAAVPQTSFSLLPVRQKFRDAMQQAEYAYSQIESR